MSYQLICDNCGKTHGMKDIDLSRYITLPLNWESIYGSNKTDGVTKHLCDQCVMAKDQAKRNAQEKVRQAEEAALAARKVKA